MPPTFFALSNLDIFLIVFFETNAYRLLAFEAFDESDSVKCIVFQIVEIGRTDITNNFRIFIQTQVFCIFYCDNFEAELK